MIVRSTSPLDTSQKLAYHLEPTDFASLTPGGRRVILGGKDYPVVERDGMYYALMTAIETRAEASYVVAPPTVPYQLVRGDYANIATLSCGDIEQLLSVARGLNEHIDDRVDYSSQRRASESGSRPGDDFNLRGNVLAIMEKHDWQVNTRADGRSTLIRPGKTDGLSATYNFDSNNSVYVFSSNAAPFEAGKAYSPFAVRALLEFKGDYSACARACRAEGFGTEGWSPTNGGEWEECLRGRRRPTGRKSLPASSGLNSPGSAGCFRFCDPHVCYRARARRQLVLGRYLSRIGIYETIRNRHDDTTRSRHN